MSQSFTLQRGGDLENRGKLFKVTEYVGVRSASKTSSSDSPKLSVLVDEGTEQLMSGDWGEFIVFWYEIKITYK